MDVLYPLGHGSRYRNFELRLSLRSLKFIDHDRVFIIGNQYLKWFKNISFIAFPEEKNQKQLSVINKLIYMCAPDSEISEDFILMNDDFYFLERQELKSYIQKSSLSEFACKYPTSSYGLALRTTAAYLKAHVLPEINYEIHYPIVLNKKKFLNIFSRINLRSGPLVYRSIYGNTYGLPAEPADDFKIFTADDFYKKKNGSFISTDVTIPEMYNFKKFVLNKVGDKSEYETGNLFGIIKKRDLV